MNLLQFLSVVPSICNVLRGTGGNPFMRQDRGPSSWNLKTIPRKLRVDGSQLWAAHPVTVSHQCCEGIGATNNFTQPTPMLHITKS